MAGNTSGTYNHYICPLGSKVIKISGRAGVALDQINITCDDPLGTTLGPLGVIGGTGSNWTTSPNCFSGYNALSIRSATYVSQILASCVQSSSLNAVIGSSTDSIAALALQGNGRVIGMSVYSVGPITGLSFTYSDSGAWKQTSSPMVFPTMGPTISIKPSTTPTRKPTGRPTLKPTAKPSSRPTAKPSKRPTVTPSTRPTAKPSRRPTVTPSVRPTAKPSRKPTAKPSIKPTERPSRGPTAKPSRRPSARPSSKPTSNPTSPYYFARYIKLTRVNQSPDTGSLYGFHVLGIDVYDGNGTFISSQSTATMSSIFGNDANQFGPQYLIDGVHAKTDAGGNTRLPCTQDLSGSWMQLDFGKNVLISRIDVWNRVDCCSNRIIGTQFSVTNNAGTSLLSQNITVSQSIYNWYKGPQPTSIFRVTAGVIRSLLGKCIDVTAGVYASGTQP